IDAQALLLEHTVERGPGDLIDLARLVQVTSRDWGWYTTFTDNLERLTPEENSPLPADAAAQIADRVAALQQALAAAPKSLGWKARAVAGRRVPWYELPEEIGGG